MEAYLNICREILEKGVRQKNRTGVDSYVVDATMFRHDMAEGFPLLTTKKVAYKNVRSEVEFFVGGKTDKKWLQDRGNHIWDDWCSPVKVVQRVYDDRSKEIVKAVLGDKYIGISKDIFDVALLLGGDFEMRKRHGISDDDFSRLEALSDNRLAMSRERDLGPIYGFQWRHFDARYRGIEGTLDGQGNIISYDGEGLDQLAGVVNTLKGNPTDRRMIVAAWNPKTLQEQALPPCHYGFEVGIIGDRLNLAWNQRSVDVPLGLPFNIASYATILHLLAKETGFKEGMLTGFLFDTHAYENQIEGLEEQISREPKDLPEIETKKFSSIFDWNFMDTKIIGYDFHPEIKFPIAV